MLQNNVKSRVVAVVVAAVAAVLMMKNRKRNAAKLSKNRPVLIVRASRVQIPATGLLKKLPPGGDVVLVPVGLK